MQSCWGWVNRNREGPELSQRIRYELNTLDLQCRKAIEQIALVRQVEISTKTRCSKHTQADIKEWFVLAQNIILTVQTSESRLQRSRVIRVVKFLGETIKKVNKGNEILVDELGKESDSLHGFREDAGLLESEALDIMKGLSDVSTLDNEQGEISDSLDYEQLDKFLDDYCPSTSEFKVKSKSATPRESERKGRTPRRKTDERIENQEIQSDSDPEDQGMGELEFPQVPDFPLSRPEEAWAQIHKKHTPEEQKGKQKMQMAN